MATIIGILGLMGSGKSTVADEFINLGFQKDSFAASLKDACSAIFGWDRELLEGDTDESRIFRETPDLFWSNKTKIQEFTPRLALQQIGTDIMRDQFHEDIWINSFEYRLRKKSDQNIVISDCRFVNEVELIRRMGGVLVRVDRGENPEWHKIACSANTSSVALNIMETKYADVHKSEWSLVGIRVDYVVSNSGTLDQLKNKVKFINSYLMKKK